MCNTTTGRHRQQRQSADAIKDSRKECLCMDGGGLRASRGRTPCPSPKAPKYCRISGRSALRGSRNWTAREAPGDRAVRGGEGVELVAAHRRSLEGSAHLTPIRPTRAEALSHPKTNVPDAGQWRIIGRIHRLVGRRAELRVDGQKRPPFREPRGNDAVPPAFKVLGPLQARWRARIGDLRRLVCTDARTASRLRS